MDLARSAADATATGSMTGREADRIFAASAAPVSASFSCASCADGITRQLAPRSTRSLALYRPRLVRHLVGAYAALAAGGSCAARMAAGGRKPCRSMSHVVL